MHTIIAYSPIYFKQILTVWVRIVLDYYKIGQRIRKSRKAQGLSQEQLAEMVGISLPHMSHIETANTKLSLPVLVDIAAALGVSTDELLRDEPEARRKEAETDIQSILSACNPQQAKAIAKMVRGIKSAMDEYL